MWVIELGSLISKTKNSSLDHPAFTLSLSEGTEFIRQWLCKNLKEIAESTMGFTLTTMNLPPPKGSCRALLGHACLEMRPPRRALRSLAGPWGHSPKRQECMCSCRLFSKPLHLHRRAWGRKWMASHYSTPVSIQILRLLNNGLWSEPSTRLSHFGITEVKEALAPCNMPPGVRKQAVNRQTNKRNIR